MDNQYTIDASGRIVSVGAKWDDHARRNDAPKAVSNAVIGRNWSEFVSGVQTRSYLNAIFFACRMDNEEFSMLCRCDAANEKKLYRFSVAPQEDETLLVTHEYMGVSDQVQREVVLSVLRRVDTTRCSICCSFLLGDNWIDPFSSPDAQYFAQGFGVCPTCKTSALNMIETNRRQRKKTQRAVIPFGQTS